MKALIGSNSNNLETMQQQDRQRGNTVNVSKQGECSIFVSRALIVVLCIALPSWNRALALKASTVLIDKDAYSFFLSSSLPERNKFLYISLHGTDPWRLQPAQF